MFTSLKLSATTFCLYLSSQFLCSRRLREIPVIPLITPGFRRVISRSLSIWFRSNVHSTSGRATVSLGINEPIVIHLIVGICCISSTCVVLCTSIASSVSIISFASFKLASSPSGATLMMSSSSYNPSPASSSTLLRISEQLLQHAVISLHASAIQGVNSSPQRQLCTPLGCQPSSGLQPLRHAEYAV